MNGAGLVATRRKRTAAISDALIVARVDGFGALRALWLPRLRSGAEARVPFGGPARCPRERDVPRAGERSLPPARDPVLRLPWTGWNPAARTAARLRRVARWGCQARGLQRRSASVCRCW